MSALLIAFKFIELVCGVGGLFVCWGHLCIAVVQLPGLLSFVLVPCEYRTQRVGGKHAPHPTQPIHFQFL
jgi:hypothetical protein